MIKTIELELEVFKKTEEQLNELQNKKDHISQKEYNLQKKEIMKSAYKSIKEIEKQYPLKKEIHKLLEKEKQTND